MQDYYLGRVATLNRKEFASVRGREALGFLGQWPDLVRRQKMAPLFKTYGTVLPDGLSAWRRQYSSTWHYHNHVVRSEINASVALKIVAAFWSLWRISTRRLPGP